jgi:LPS-assembly lipoprotein
MKLKWLWVCCCCLLLAGCGYHLRGHAPLPPQLQALNLQSSAPYSQLSKQLRRSLRNRGAHLTQAAPITLRILTQDMSDRIVSIGLSTITRQKIFTLLIQYQLEDPKGNIIHPQQNVQVQKFVTFDSNQILGSTTQEELIISELNQEAVNQLIEQLILILSSPREN